MIKIKKPKDAPGILQEKGKSEIDSLCKEYLADKDKYITGKKKFKFKKTIYGGNKVKEVLIKAQHGKCFVCESKIIHISYGDVEHFRPKGGVRQSDGEKMEPLGYYWLAYVWENLFLSCQICNQRFKKNFFPLENPDQRVRSHEGVLSEEKPLFINPETENPEEFISFRGEVPYGTDKSNRGKTTIELLGLNRNTLNEERLKKLKLLKTIYTVAKQNPASDVGLEASILLQESQSDLNEYAAAIRDNVKDGFEYIL